LSNKLKIITYSWSFEEKHELRNCLGMPVFVAELEDVAPFCFLYDRFHLWSCCNIRPKRTTISNRNQVTKQRYTNKIIDSLIYSTSIFVRNEPNTRLHMYTLWHNWLTILFDIFCIAVEREKEREREREI
jgi:hypothetical protein